MWRKGNPQALLVGMQIGAVTMANSMEVPQKNKIRTTLWPSNSTSGYASKATQNTNLKQYMHTYVCCSVICNSQDMEAAQEPINRQVDKEAVEYIYNGILFDHKTEILPFVTVWIYLEYTMFSEISQTEKDNYKWFHLHMESKEQNKWTNKTGTDSQIQRTNWWLSDGVGWGWGAVWKTWRH